MSEENNVSGLSVATTIIMGVSMIIYFLSKPTLAFENGVFFYPPTLLPLFMMQVAAVGILVSLALVFFELFTEPETSVVANA